MAGVATFSGCDIDDAGTYTLTATDDALATATSDPLTITFGAAAKVAFTTQPAGATGGTAFTTQPVVTVQDASGNTVTNNTSNVVLSITGAPDAVLTCTNNTVAAAAGVANFAACNIDDAATYTLTAADTGLVSATSASLVVAVGAAAELTFIGQPVGSSAGSSFFAQPIVAVQDAGGNTLTTDAGDVTLTITGTPGGVVLTCTPNPQAAIQGVANFAGCSIDTAGTYTLTAARGGLTSGISASVTITDPT